MRPPHQRAHFPGQAGAEASQALQERGAPGAFMSDIFREVEEDIRREQMTALWRRYGVYVMGAAVLIVVVTAGWRGWEWYSARQAAAQGALYFDALQIAARGDHADAERALSSIAGEGGPFAPLAKIRAAAELAAAGDREAAIEAFQAVAADQGVDPLLRETAQIRAGYLMVDFAEPAEIEQRLSGLATEGSAWRHSAREILGLAAYRAGDLETAASRFEELLGDPQTPQDMQSRAQLMLSLINADRPVSASQGQQETTDQ